MNEYKHERQASKFSEEDAMQLLYKHFPQGYWYEASRDEGIIRVNILFDIEEAEK